jgi:hypothetical protein
MFKTSVSRRLPPKNVTENGKSPSSDISPDSSDALYVPAGTATAQRSNTFPK